MEKKINIVRCPKCGSGKIDIVSNHSRQIYLCNLCSHFWIKEKER